MRAERRVDRIGMDIHRNFSPVTARDDRQRIVWRRRLEHRDRRVLRRTLGEWPTGTPVVLEGSFGWSWSVKGQPADAMVAAARG